MVDHRGRGAGVRAGLRRAPVAGAVHQPAEQRHGPGHRLDQPRLRGGAANVGNHAAVCGCGRRPLRLRPGDGARRRPRHAPHGAHAACPRHLDADPADRRRRRRRRRDGGPGRAHVGGRPRRAAATARPRQRHRQCGRLVRAVRRGAGRAAPHRRPRLGGRALRRRRDGAGGRAARLAAARQARGRAGRAARSAGKVDAGRGARRDARPELHLSHDGILRLRLPRRLHRHAPAWRRRLLPAAARSRGVVAVAHRPVQHRRQLHRRLGDRALAHEVGAVAAVRRARAGGDCIPRRAEDHHHFPRLRGGDRLHLPRHGAADGRAGRQAPRHALPRHPLRHRHAVAPDRRLPRRLARRKAVRGDRRLRVDVVRGRDAGLCRRADPPADQRSTQVQIGRGCGVSGAGTQRLLEAPVLPALAYSDVLFAGAVLVWLANTFASALRGSGNTALPAGALAVAALVQIPLSGALTLGWWPFPALGIRGTALAYALAFGVAALGMGLYLWSSPLRPGGSDWRLERRLFGEILRVGALSSVSALQTVLTAIILTGCVGSFGTAALAGYGVGVRLELLQVPIVFAIGQALVILVGTHIGAGRPARAKRIAWTGTLLAVGVSLAIGVSAALFPAAWVRIFSDDPDVLETGGLYLRSVAPFYALFAAGMALYFASQGAGRVGLPILAGTARLAVVAAGGLIVVQAGAPLAALFGVIAFGIALFGALTGAAVYRATWEAAATFRPSSGR